MRKYHLIQPRELFGPPERQEELRTCWAANAYAFDDITAVYGWPTFNELLSACKPDRFNVIANSDIYFEELPKEGPRIGECWALSRWNVLPDGEPVLWNMRDSQDVWVLNGLPPEIDADFNPGTPGCDNRLCWLLGQHLKVRNPSKTVKAYHLHLSEYRSYGEGRGMPKMYRLPPPYAFATPEEL